MPLVAFQELMQDAARGGYAVGYFESWNLESLLAVADAAEAMRAPVLLGFSGIFLPHPARATREHLADYAALGLAVCRRLTVPACLVFNESPDFDWVMEAIQLGFGLVMYSDEHLTPAEQIERVKQLTKEAHHRGLAVEAELRALPGVGGELNELPAQIALTDAGQARTFVAATAVDALAVNVGQVHLHGRRAVRLDLARLDELHHVLTLPLVLHGATSVARDDLQHAIQLGIRKVNIGSALKQSYFDALQRACAQVGAPYNPYEVVGSGLERDVETQARLALQNTVQAWLQLLGSAWRA